MKYNIFKQIFLFVCHDLFKEDSPGHLLLRCLRSYLNFTMYNELKMHTETTILAMRFEVQVFDSLMKVCAYFKFLCSSEFEHLCAQKYITDTKGTQYEKNWNFIKYHLRIHAADDIIAKGPSRGMSTKPYEKMHGPFKKIYQRQTNFKDTDSQVFSQASCRVSIELNRPGK